MLTTCSGNPKLGLGMELPVCGPNLLIAPLQLCQVLVSLPPPPPIILKNHTCMCAVLCFCNDFLMVAIVLCHQIGQAKSGNQCELYGVHILSARPGKAFNLQHTSESEEWNRKH